MMDQLARRVEVKNRSRFGRAASSSAGSASRFSAVSTLKLIAANPNRSSGLQRPPTYSRKLPARDTPLINSNPYDALH